MYNNYYRTYMILCITTQVSSSAYIDTVLVLKNILMYTICLYMHVSNCDMHKYILYS